MRNRFRINVSEVIVKSALETRFTLSAAELFSVPYAMRKIDIQLSLSEFGGFSIEIDGKPHENVSSTIAEDLVLCAMIRAEDTLLRAAGREREIVDTV